LPSVQDPTSADDPTEELAEEPLTEEEAPTEALLGDEEPPIEEDVDNQNTQHTTKKAKKINHLKCYVCLFTCAVTRAIHLELTPDLTARSFLFAFRKFAARRGPISVMYSDNAQTFRCADRHLKLLNADPTIHDYLAARKTRWIFSASLAPWWGGFWERMVRSVKDLLRRSNGRACLDYMELEASLVEIESVINARPISYVGEGADDPLPITPNQFLNNRRSTRADPEPAINLMAPTSTSIALLELDKLRRDYVTDICSRFVNDYLLQLDNFHSKGKSGRKIRLGEIVVIHDEHSKRLMWSIGVVKELIPSRDGLIRSVMLKVPNGNIINRAIQSLHPIELREDLDEDVEVANLELIQEQEDNPAPPALEAEAGLAVRTIIPDYEEITAVVDEVELNATGSGGECVGNRIAQQPTTTRSGRRSNTPLHLREYCLGGPR